MNFRSIFPVLLSGFALSAIAAPTGYTIVDLGASHRPEAIDTFGRIVGTSLRNGVPYRAEEWAIGQWMVLDSHGRSVATAIDQGHPSVGEDSGRPVRWWHRRRYPIDGVSHGSAEGLSDRAHIIVGTRKSHGTDSCWSWRNRIVTELGSLGGGQCQVQGVDHLGRYIVGQSTIATGDYHAFIHDAEGMHDLGVLNLDGGTSIANAVNVHRHVSVTSQYDDAGDQTAAFWNGKKLVQIPGVTGAGPGSSSYAGAINGLDEMLVAGEDSKGHFLFIYDGGSGAVTPVEPLIHNIQGWSFDWSLVGAPLMIRGLSDRENITGSATFNGEEHAYLLVPDGPG